MLEAFYPKAKDVAVASFARRHVCPFTAFTFHLNKVLIYNNENRADLRKLKRGMLNSSSVVSFNRFWLLH